MDHAKNLLGIRSKNEISAFAAIGRKCMPVIFSNLGFGNGAGNLVPEGVHVLKLVEPYSKWTSTS